MNDRMRGNDPQQSTVVNNGLIDSVSDNMISKINLFLVWLTENTLEFYFGSEKIYSSTLSPAFYQSPWLSPTQLSKQANNVAWVVILGLTSDHDLNISKMSYIEYMLHTSINCLLIFIDAEINYNSMFTWILCSIQGSWCYSECDKNIRDQFKFKLFQVWWGWRQFLCEIL